MSRPERQSGPVLMDGAVAVVVGSGGGIGREIALRMGAEGADVVLSGRSADAMSDVAAQLADRGRRALVVPADLRDPDSVATLADRAVAELGRVDALVVNSGVAGPTKPITEIDVEEWRDVFAVNVTGVFLCARAFLPAMQEARSGSIVVIGSVSGKRPLKDRSPYCASKTALIGFVRTLAVEAGPYGIRANMISPGGVEGERLDRVIAGQARAQGISESEARDQFSVGSPLGRLVSARNVADTAVFLSSAYASATTGEDVNVAAGLVMY